MAYPEYYEILNISPAADMQEVKDAYRKLVKEYHPDINKNRRDAEEKLKKINEAYAVLKDYGKRARYDYSGRQHTDDTGGSKAEFKMQKTENDEQKTAVKKTPETSFGFWFTKLLLLILFVFYLYFIYSNADRNDPYNVFKMIDNSAAVVDAKLHDLKDMLLQYNDFIAEK